MNTFRLFRSVLIASALVLFAACLISCDKKGEGEYFGTLETFNDSVSYRIDRFSGTFAFDEIEPFDTINNELEADLYLFAGNDTLVLSPDTTDRLVKIINGDSSTVLTVTFFNLSKKAYRDKIELLKEFADFSEAPSTLQIRFAYSAPNDPDLTELRESYRLDSVAGNGNEISRIVNLMNWAHGIVRHDGSEDPADPKPRNALNIIATCKSEDKGVNCRMMATLLNEAYLASGFKARHITCLPYDKEDPDCHVINTVYSDSLNKWLYVDPTFAAYFMDVDSNLLGIEEVRRKLIAGEELLLPGNINWNGAPHDKGAYKSYMAKNLFRFFCPLKSEFGYESKDNPSWVYLNPTGYDSQLTNTADTTKGDDSQSISYYIDDNKCFWAKP